MNLILNLRGRDGDASYRLHQYYTYVCFNIPKQIKYLARSASQGNIIAQYNYAMILSSEEDDSYLKYYNLDNAINWLKMAASHGYIKAEVELLRLERLKETIRLGKIIQCRRHKDARQDIFSYYKHNVVKSGAAIVLKPFFWLLKAEIQS